MNEKQKPYKTIRSGKVQLAMWWNEQYKSFSYSLQKNHKDKNGEWQNSNFFNMTDLTDVAYLCQLMKIKNLEKQLLGQVPAKEAPQQEASQQEAPQDFNKSVKEEQQQQRQDLDKEKIPF